jgi:ArsR family transcriptional regulator, arsenate/arsenite/antimonite-responsive transcriptional repressor
MDLPLSQSLQALSDPTRREILRLLRERDLTAGEIAANFSMSAPSISHHLGVLKNAALVRARRDGQTIVYSLNSSVVQELLQEIFDILQTGKEEARNA